MKKKLGKFIHSKGFIIVLILLLIATTTLVGTYAWFTWSNPADQNTIFTMSIGEIVDVTFGNGNVIDGKLNPVYNYYDGLSTSFDINNKSSSRIGYNIVFNVTSIDNELISKDVKYTVIVNDQIVYDGDLSSVSSGDNFTLYTGEMPSGLSTYRVYFYIDGNKENNSNMMNKSISGNIVVEADLVYNAVEYITNLYLNNNPTLMSQADSNDEYYYASDVNLMNDGLDGEGNFTNSISKGNIRYYGSNPDNYIDIGLKHNDDIKYWPDFFNEFKNDGIDLGMPETVDECVAALQCENLIANGYGTIEELDECKNSSELTDTINSICVEIKVGDPKLYRIIGVFQNMELEDGTKDTLIKVMSSNTVGSMKWDDVDNRQEWSDSSLNAYLNNGDYYNGLPVDLKNIIENVNWNIARLTNNNYNGSPYLYYLSEKRGVSLDDYSGETSVPYKEGVWCVDSIFPSWWYGKIALASISDYYFSKSLDNSWFPNANAYALALYYGVYFGFDTEPYIHATPEYRYFLNSSKLSLDGSTDVYPTFYLKSNVLFEDGGDGSEGNPYRLVF